MEHRDRDRDRDRDVKDDREDRDDRDDRERRENGTNGDERKRESTQKAPVGARANLTQQQTALLQHLRILMSQSRLVQSSVSCY